MGESVRLNAELSSRVEERGQELRTVFDRLRRVEAQRVLDEERQRLMRDMHDGLGSHLVQTLNMVHHSGDAGVVDRGGQHAHPCPGRASPDPFVS